MNPSSLVGSFCVGTALLLGACTEKPSPPFDPSCVKVASDYGPSGTTPIQVDTVVTGLEVPWSILFLPGGDLLVTERPGRLRRVSNGKLLPPIAHVPISQTGEGGLLGAVLHPQFADNRLFYLYYTTSKAGRDVNRVERWRLAADGLGAERERVILDDIPAAKYHDGGRLRFGPDGKLYIGTGDAKREELAQSLRSLAGKLLRLEADGSIPSDNPFGKSPVYLLGIRNTQGFDWLDDGTLIVTDHGPSGILGRKGHDEVNVAAAGANLGWPNVFGCETKPKLVSPVLTWKEAVPPGGAAIYRGDSIPTWRGSLLIGTLQSKHLHRVQIDAARRRLVRHEVYLEGEPPNGLGRLREVIMGPDAHLYVTTSNCDGRGDCPDYKDVVARVRGAAQ